MANLGDGFKDIFLAGVGAMAITGERTKDLVNQLISKGELTVEQGKQINSELSRKAQDVASSVEFNILETRMAAMTPEERSAFAAKAAELAAKGNEQEASSAEVGDASAVSVGDASKAPDTEAVPQTPGA